MKVVKTRKEHRCRFEHCCFGFIVKEGSIAVTQSIKTIKPNSFFILHYHPECFVQSVSKYVNDKVKALEAKQEERLRKNTPKGARGRPPKTNDPARYRALKALLWYHHKVGNDERAQEIDAKMKEMELDNQVP